MRTAARLKFDDLVVPGALNFGDVREEHAFALAVGSSAGGVVETEHHVLRGHDGRIAVRREEHVVRSHHQAAGSSWASSDRGNVDGHLVTVEVGVERRADERVELDGLALR